MMLTRAEFQRASLDFQRTSLELQNKIDKQFSEIMAALNRSRDDELCDDRSPLDRYSPSSQKVKGSRFDHFERSGVDRRFGGGQFHEGDRQTYGSSAELLDLRFRDYLMLRNDDDDETWTWTETDQAFDDEDLVETEIATEFIGIEDETVKREANAEVISAIKKEQIPQIQVPISKLEHGLQIRNASPVVCEDFRSLVGFDGLFDHVKARAESVTKSTSVTNNQVTHQLFDEIPLRKGILPKEHKERFHKSWRFKFKHSVAPRDSKSVSDVLRTTLGPSSMLKMLLEAVGIVVTTDGNAILLEIDVANPAAKSMIELSHTQDEEVGVGITSVIVLAGELSQPIDVKDRATVLGVVKKLEMRFMTSKQQVLLHGMKPGSVGEIRAQKLNKIQQCRLSLRAIRVWDPGGSNSETDCLKA